MASTEDLAYAAGVFDGEGNVRARYVDPNNRRRVGICLQVAQGHPQMIERFHQAVGVGKVYGPKPWSVKNPKPSWWFGAYSRESVHLICWLLWPWLSEPKRQQFDQAFENYHALKAMTNGGENDG